MRIRNNTPSNISVPAMSSRGAAHKNYMVVVGNASLELDDDVWLNEYAENSSAILKANNLEITKSPELTEGQRDEKEANALEAARKLVADADAKEVNKTHKVEAHKVTDKVTSTTKTTT